jgi:hypothetical protein
MSNQKYNKILINIMNNDMENLEIYHKRVCDIFNKCSSEVQIDFIKFIFIKNKHPFDDLIISNTNTIKELLKWGCKNNTSLCEFVLNHKDILLDNDFYYLLESLAGINKDLVYLITHHRIKDIYQTDSSSESENYDDTSDFCSSDSSSIFSSDLDEKPKGNYYTNSKNVIDVD